MKENIFKLAISIGVCAMAGAIGSLFTASSVGTWYTTLAKPLLNPPSWVFGPVWTTLYLLMGISLFLVWKSDAVQKKKAITIFGIQLFFNALWSIVFFGMQNPGLALLVILILWIYILWSIVLFKRISKIAAYLLIPYILWVSFAAYLNLMIWGLN